MTSSTSFPRLVSFFTIYWWRFVRTSFSRRGLFCADGRKLIFGKIRRIGIALVPGLTQKLKLKHGISGGCAQCGASCNLLFRCPAWDEKTGLCQVYKYRPQVCRIFPITKSDILERDLVRNGKACGFSFEEHSNSQR